MLARFRCFAALIVGITCGVVGLSTASPAAATAVSPPPRTVDSWAWCGVNPDDPSAATAVRTMVQAAGIDATFGPCNVPTNYTPAEPGNRYVAPDVYMRLVQLNAS